METLKYKVITSEKQYDDYCKKLEDLVFSKSKGIPIKEFRSFSKEVLPIMLVIFLTLGPKVSHTMIILVKIRTECQTGHSTFCTYSCLSPFYRPHSLLGYVMGSYYWWMWRALRLPSPLMPIRGALVCLPILTLKWKILSLFFTKITLLVTC